MQFHKHRDGFPSVMIIPMIDIMFFLLVFFMLSSINMCDREGIPVSLPTAKSIQLDKVEGINLFINKENKLFYDDREINLKQLQTLLNDIVTNNPNAMIILSIDQNSQFSSTSQILSVLKQVGVKNVAFAAEKRD